MTAAPKSCWEWTGAPDQHGSPNQLRPGQNGPCSSWQRAKRACPRGHAYDVANTGRRRDGSRYCRACARDRMSTRRTTAS